MSPPSSQSTSTERALGAPGETAQTAPGATRGLAQRLQGAAGDRVASARVGALEAARELHSWALEQPLSWTAGAAARDLEEGWREWREEQAWRGTCALLVDDVRLALSAGGTARAALVAECRAWLDSEEPSAQAARLVNPERVVPHALRDLQPEDWVLVHGYSELCVKALAAAQHAGLAPRVLLSELAADASGKRMARELLGHGLRVRLCWDLAAVAALERVDRVWLAAQAVGAGSYVGHVGSALLCERARAAEVPTRVLATASDMLPGGMSLLPAWGESESETLWCFAPEGVELCAQPFEVVEAEDVDLWITEDGPQSFTDFSLRSLRPSAAASMLCAQETTPRTSCATTIS